jgi:hypothetical protein
MSKPGECPSQADWLALAKIADIPRGPAQDRFCALMSDAISFVQRPPDRDRVINKPSAVEVEDLACIADLADQLYTALSRCRTNDPVAYILEGTLEPGTFLRLRRLRDDLLAVVPKLKSVTRRRPIKNNITLAQFIDRTLTAVDEAGGHLTFDKNYRRATSIRREHRGKDGVRSGSFLQFLDRLRRHLPHDFLPRDHPISLYARLKKDWSTNRGNRTKIPA